MNEPKTPNLGLNKIDRSSPSTTYFDLDKYLDQNWEKVDEGVGQVEEKAEETAAQVSSIQERLDTEKRRSVTLEPGLQIINAERVSAFKLEALKGRTLMNLLGRDGGCERIGAFSSYQATLSADTSKKAQGSQSLKITTTATPSGLSTSTVFTLKAGSYYLIAADVKLVSGTSLGVYLNGITSTKGNVNSIDSTKFNTVWKAYSVSATETSYAVGEVVGPVGSNGNVDALRVYEISSEDYVALDNMTTEQVNAKYPYVDSVQPVRNPYAIRYGENLLPPFYDEWQNAPRNDSTGKGSISSPYEYTVVANAAESWIGSPWIPAIPGKAYTFSAEHNGQIHLVFADKDKIAISGTGYAAGQTATLVAPVNAAYVVAYFRNTGSAAGTFSIKNPMLVLGTTAKPFKPREDAILALQTDLYANPLTGANADEVFEKDGQYFKLAKWKKASIIPTDDYGVNASSYTGYKQVTLFMPKNVDTSNVAAYMTKYDGNLLELDRVSSPFPKSDLFNVGNESNKGYVWMTVSNADSGWGDSYNPTAAEIKAYFMGWRMYRGEDGAAFTPYNGTGTKYWARIKSDGTFTGGELTLPTTRAVDYTPYQLVYQLATPTVEPITSEGQLTLIEGNNQVEVGTGLVVREGTKPALSTLYNTYEINSINAVGTVASNPLKYKAKRVLTIYKNNRQDKWMRISDTNSYGSERAFLDSAMFDPSATYTVTYLMLDTSPAAPFVGSVAENEKALLTDMNDVVRQNAAAVSVVEMAVNEAVRQLLQQENKRNVWGEIL
ncbi:hypothetical protein V6669_06360 [Paenibacillus sp. Y5S-9]|uniref:hypothetical protein n=1 Tax=Paenibacillus sp. Y5S-9 TaxID=3122489 RepID=UPI0030D1EF44